MLSNQHLTLTSSPPFKIPILANRLANWRLFCCNYSFHFGSSKFALKPNLSTKMCSTSWFTCWFLKKNCIQNKTIEMSTDKSTSWQYFDKKIRLKWRYLHNFNIHCTYLDISNPFSLKKCILHKKFSSPKEERCDLILWSFCCFRWIDLSPRRAFYGQENCNLSLYKSTRISLTNAILYSQSPVYLQQLRLERGRILNAAAMAKHKRLFICSPSSSLLTLIAPFVLGHAASENKHRTLKYLTKKQ